MAINDPPPETSLAADDDSEDTLVQIDRPLTASELEAPGLTDLGADHEPDLSRPDLPRLASKDAAAVDSVTAPVADPQPSAAPASTPAIADLPRFDEDDDDDDDDDTEFLPRAAFLKGHSELRGRLDASASVSGSPAARVRSLDSLGRLSLAALAAQSGEEEKATSSAAFEAEAKLATEKFPVIEDDDPERQEPRRLSALLPIEMEPGDDVTLSRPVLHRATFRPSGEGNPGRLLEEAGGPPAAFASSSGKAVVALSSTGVKPPAALRHPPPRPLPPIAGAPPANFDADDETLTPDPSPLARHLDGIVAASDESTDTSLEHPQVRQVGLDSETATMQRPVPTAPHHGLDPNAGLLVDTSLADALVVDDELPPEISAPSEAAAQALDADISITAPNDHDDSDENDENDEGRDDEQDFRGAATDVRQLPPPSADFDSLVEEEPGSLTIDVPVPATVYVDGVEVGQGPTTIAGLNRFATYNLRVHCPGFLPWSGSATLRGAYQASMAPELLSR